MLNKITFYTNKYKETTNSRGFHNSCLSPLKTDKVSFGALKKSQFSGIDLFVINKYKAPIEKFNTNEDFQNWCNKKVKEITKKDYKGRQNETVIQRKAILKEWFDYVQNENDAYNDAISLLILDGITKNLKPDEDTLPPVLNKGILAQTVEEIQNKSKDNPKFDVNFSKIYQLNMQKVTFDNTENSLDNSQTGWIIIPSKNNDPENFEENVEKLKLLSHHNWCTKSFNAEPYLSKGDFHIYLENGKPKLGVRFVDNEIEEIQGERNNLEIPVKYFDIAKEHIENEKLSKRAVKEIKQCERTKEKIANIKSKIDIKNSSPEEIFRFFDIEVTKDIERFTLMKHIKSFLGIAIPKNNDVFLTISEYRQPDEDFSFEDLGIDENKLIKNVKVIKGVANFSGSQITSLGNLEYIGGDANFKGSHITSLGNIKSIGGDAIFENSMVTDLGNLKSIGRDAEFYHSKITDLGNLKSIGGNAKFSYSMVSGLGNLKSIGRHANFLNSQISSLGALESIGMSAYFGDSQITSLGNLKSIGETAYFQDSKITDLSNLKSIGDCAFFKGSEITDLGNLRTIGKDADFSGSKVEKLGKLKSIGSNAYLNGSKITDLSNLQSVKTIIVNENQTKLIKEAQKRKFKIMYAK